MSHHVDYKPLAIHENDNDLIREVTVTRYQIFESTGLQRTPLMFKYRDDAQCSWNKKPGDYIVEITFHRYCLVDPQENRRSHWFVTKEECENFALVYPPDKRPNFGKDEYDRP